MLYFHGHIRYKLNLSVWIPMKIASVIGTRPQVIKLLPIYTELAVRNIEHVVIDTGQHFDPELSTDLYIDLGLPLPTYQLSLDSPPDRSSSIQIAQMITTIKYALEVEKPDKVLVYGDTNSTLAASLVCAKEGFNFAHIEAGLRSRDQTMPEEINRILVDNLAHTNFAPTLTADNNLRNEGLQEKSFFVGDIMLDTFLILRSRIDQAKSEIENLPSRFYLLTLHRPSNVDDLNRLQYILGKLNNLGEKIVFSVHPRTKNNLHMNLQYYENILAIPPQPYLVFSSLMRNCLGLFTDSGGLQKEAYFHGTPTLTIRNSTEWPETLSGYTNILDFNLESLNIFTEKCAAGKFNVNLENFGSGIARMRIIDFLTNS